MEFAINKKDLLRSVGRVHAVADRKSSMPILSNVLITADESGFVRFAATDLYLSVDTKSEAIVKRGGTAAIAARTLFDVVKTLPDGEVKLKIDPKNSGVHLTSGKIKFRIPGMPGEDFPPLPSPGDSSFAEIDAGDLSRLIGLTQYSMSNDDTRPHLAGTLLETTGQFVRMVATDGHRLSKAEAASTAGAFKMLVPQKGVLELKRLLSDKEIALKGAVWIACVGGNAFFQAPDLMLSVKLSEEHFPPYSKVIPQSHTRRVVAARDLLVDSLRRISLVASDKSGGIRLVLSSGALKIESENQDVGEGDEELAVDYEGEPLSIGVNARYLLEVASAMPDDEVALEMGGELDPIVVKPAGDDRFVGVIMPMRV